ncbi:prepilin-type N-terminal cleavage/methylation domain-containing protein [Pseudomonas aeruginosa]|nr:prepilin-type N-terminal cleavage/methylation domain-containing protein [Pseudomonas aeruginosa]
MVRSRGFTLIELAVCLVIVAVMTVALLPGAMEKYQQGKINSSIEQARNLIPVCEIARTKAVSSTVGANLKVTHTYGSLTNWSKTADLQNLLSADYRLPATNPLGSNILVKFDSQRCYVAVDLPSRKTTTVDIPLKTSGQTPGLSSQPGPCRVPLPPGLLTRSESSMKKRRANSQASMGGFTLIELAIVLAVMALIAVYTTPRYMEQLNQKRAILTAQETQSFLDAARSYRMQNGSWPGQASSCANAKSVLESTSPPTLAGISATNKYNQAVTPACDANTFSITQSIAQDWDGVVANNLPGTVISNASTYTIRSTIGIPGSEPALNSKLSRVYTGDPEMNRMRTPLLLGEIRSMKFRTCI